MQMILKLIEIASDVKKEVKDQVGLTQPSLFCTG